MFFWGFFLLICRVFLDKNDSFCFCLYLWFCFFGCFFFTFGWTLNIKTNLEWLYHLNRDIKGKKIKNSNRIASKKNQHTMVTRDKIFKKISYTYPLSDTTQAWSPKNIENVSGRKQRIAPKTKHFILACQDASKE